LSELIVEIAKINFPTIMTHSRIYI